MAFRNREMLSDFFECDRRRGFKLLRRQAGLTQLRRNRHREASRVRSSQQLFGVRALFQTVRIRLRFIALALFPARSGCDQLRADVCDLTYELRKA